MAKVNSLLMDRFKTATQKLSKMASLAERSSNGELSSFSGVFRVSSLSETEKNSVQELLSLYRLDTQETEGDWKILCTITAEIKAINSQALLLHGERIKKAQELLKKYKDGAFSAWLIATYGNRQTPYNFLQYYELQKQLPSELHKTLEEMPKQAVYSLASREGPLPQKEEIIRNYHGEPKQELLESIRKAFPLTERDGRAQDMAEVAISSLRRLHRQLTTNHFAPSDKQKKEIGTLLNSLQKLI